MFKRLLTASTKGNYFLGIAHSVNKITGNPRLKLQLTAEVISFQNRE